MEHSIMLCAAGRAGDGFFSFTQIFSKVMQRLGYHINEHRDIGSNIKGKPSAFHSIISENPVYGKKDAVDILVGVDGESFRKRISELAPEGACILDSSPTNPSPKGTPIVLSDDERRGLTERKAAIYELPFVQLARQHFQDPIYRNMIVLGALARLTGLARQHVEDLVRQQYGKRKYGAQIVGKNLQAFDLGYAQAAEWKPLAWQITARENAGRLLFLLGDEAIAFGALAGGCRFFVGYPITPASEIFELLMAYISELGGVAIQATSELEAASFVSGAFYAGVRAMTATSGPGFSLMAEAISGAGCAETPMVIALIQRGGPGTGLASRTAQEDLLFAAFAGHGEFPRIIMSPATAEECFLFSAQAFNLAERYQCLVIILSEQCVGQARYTVERLPLEEVRIDRGKLLSQEDTQQMLAGGRAYARYELTEDGISPRAFPGTSGICVRANSSEHDRFGYPSDLKNVRNEQVRKRLKKTETMVRDALFPETIESGDHDAKIGFVSYGGTLGPILQAMDDFAVAGLPTKFLRLRTLWPFPAESVRRFVHSCRRVYVVEQNSTGQLRKLIQMEVTGPSKKLYSILRDDGLPFIPRDIREGVQ